ncbi:MAG: N-acetyltransferase [Micavibrio aeruginosavorus]|uniref:N-acetyltransferase n=1 Tax=Micavibrio aeruginosavorus TaxID=349221 RepID=A0A2W5MYD6_9BACT|nr:MAG: N-acetyltransferase [Micavibrio aeruginosavorus]
MIAIREGTKYDIPALYALYAQIGKKDDGYFEHAFEAGAVPVLAHEGEALCGFGLLNWSPRYSLYKRLGIPELQDLNVIAERRRQGIAQKIITYCEDVARARGCEMMGLAVGLTKDYGPAQILYAKLGYIPDGNGVTYDREGVRSNATYPLDDDLALMLVKTL